MDRTTALDLPVFPLVYDLEIAPYAAETNVKYGAKASRDIEKLLKSNQALFTGGTLDQDEKDMFYEAITKAYWASKNEVKRIYGKTDKEK